MSSNIPLDFSITQAVPGLGRPLDYIPLEDDPLYIGPPLATALLPVCKEMWQSSFSNRDGIDSREKCFINITTLREFSMLQFMNSVTDKSEWEKKIFDTGIVNKWRKETVDNPDVNMTDLMFDHCIAELQDLATNLLPERPHRAIMVYDGNVVKSDDAIPATIKFALQDAVKSLEDVPGKLKDWHPGSDGTVLDLVHPSLFPVIYGKTKVLKIGERVVGLHDCVIRCGEGEILQVNEDHQPNRDPWLVNSYSLKFQWLPCEVVISDRDNARIISYVNNLHPDRHSSLYGLIERIIDAAIPLWEVTLAPLYDEDFFYSRRLSCEPDYEFLDDDELGYPRERVVQPEPRGFKEFRQWRRTPKAINFRELYGEQARPLQIIVKLANIELTPENPTYEGGSWHVEGQQNEHIVATALYYYSCDNIKSSRLAFRQFVSPREVEEMPPTTIKIPIC